MTTIRPSISVAMCTFNGARYVREQLLSILAQTVLPDEIVIADDGSTDLTIDVVHDVLDHRESPRFVLLPSGGRLGVRRNFERAVAACSGELIALSDQDDIWTPERLERQREMFESAADLLLAFSDADIVNSTGYPLGRSLFTSIRLSRDERRSIREGRASDVLLRRNVVTGATVMLRRDLVEQARPFGEGWLHDEWLAITAASIGRIDFSEERLVAYRQHGRNEIGAPDPAIRTRLRRLWEHRGSRHRALAQRAAVLTDSLERLAGASDRVRFAAREKEAFEVWRARIPQSRLRRVPFLATRSLTSSYPRFSSQGRIDLVRDLLQPSSRES